MWVVDYEADVASDLSAFHRIDDPMTLDAARYFSLAIRLGAYSGVIAARLYEERKKVEDRNTSPTPGGRRTEAPTHVSDSVALAMLAGDNMAPERGDS